MTGREIFDSYLENRNFSGDSDDQYAQLLQTIWGHILDKIYPLLEEAERSGKRLGIREVQEEEMYLLDEICVEDVVFV